MKAIIKTVKWNKEVETKFGIMQSFYVTYNDRSASFMCKNKENPPFEEGKEYEFNETEREYQGKTYYNIKPLQENKGGFNRAVKREQSKYSGFAMSYAKDLVISGKIELKDISLYTEKMFDLMVKLDKTLES